MIKRILLPTDGSEQAQLAIRYAVSLAKLHGAHITGLHVVDIKLLEGPFLRDISASLGTAPFVNYQGNIAKLLEARGDAALDSLKDACGALDVPCDVKQETGTVAHTISEASQLADLVVLGRAGEHHEWLEGVIGSTTEAVIRRAACPVLVTGRDEATLSRVGVAYDGSPHARKALQFAAEQHEDWNVAMTVIVVASDGSRLVNEAKDYLSAHVIEAEFLVREGDAATVIVGVADELKLDLLVMGSFGHSKVLQWVVGSTTAYAVNHAPCPVLLTR
jgi:nucleotide-binding universal stress UspA family protein